MSLKGWTVHGDGKKIAPGAVVAPEERLSWGRTIGIGMQHVVAMFGATVLAPILMGFDPNTSIFFSGVGTILFLLLTRNKLPSYLGSSFAFIAPIQAYNGGKTLETTQQITQAMVSVAVTGVILALVGLLVQKIGTRWIEKLMPPVVSGAIVALIGLNLAPAAWNNFTVQPGVATITLAAIILFSVLFRGFLGRISIFLGVVVGYVFAAITGQVSFDAVSQAAWVGLPEFHLPAFGDPVSWSLLPIFLPVVLVLIAENVGHVRGVATMTGDPTINRHTGRALTADGVASTLAGLFGGSATTTYGENIGVMAATRVYSTAAYWVAAVTAMALRLAREEGLFARTSTGGNVVAALRLAERLGIGMSGSSDYHGTGKPNRLGEHLMPEPLLEQIVGRARFLGIYAVATLTFTATAPANTVDMRLFSEMDEPVAVTAPGSIPDPPSAAVLGSRRRAGFIAGLADHGLALPELTPAAAGDEA